MKTFALLATLATVGVTAAGAYHFMSAAAEKTAKEKAAKEQFSYNNVIVKYKDNSTQGDPLANVACGYANLGLKKFNEGEKLLEQLESKPESVSKDTVDAIFKSNHPFYRFLQGYCYEKGIGVDANTEKAFESYDESQKLPFSRVRHALCLINGKGVKADPEKGIDELSSLINFDDANIFDSAGAVVEEADAYRTKLSVSPSSEYPPAALALARVYLEGSGVPKNPAKALNCCMVAYANSLEGSIKLMSDIFNDVLKEAKVGAAEKLKAFSNESSPEYQAALKAFKDKNKSLQSMPDLFAKEAAKKMKEVTQTQSKKALESQCAEAGWVLDPTGTKGLCLAQFRYDKAKCYDNASAILCATQKAQATPSAKENIKLVCDSIKDLSNTAKTYGLESDLLIFNAFTIALTARSGEGIKTSDYMTVSSTRQSLAEFNSKTPTPASLVAERHLLSCELDYLTAELAEANNKMQDLEAKSPVKGIEFISKEHVRFDGTKQTALEGEAAGSGIKFKKSEAMNSNEEYSKNVSSAFAVSVNGGEGKTVSRVEFGELKSAYDTYLAEKLRIAKIIDRDQKTIQLFDRHFAFNKEAIQALVQRSGQGASAEAKAPSKQAAPNQ